MHPNISSEAVFRPLHNRTGLYFYDTAIIRPLWVKGKPVLRLEKDTETITSGESYNPFDLDARMVCEDVSRMSEKKLETVPSTCRLRLGSVSIHASSAKRRLSGMHTSRETAPLEAKSSRSEPAN
jgi:hypothetical protein